MVHRCPSEKVAMAIDGPSMAHRWTIDGPSMGFDGPIDGIEWSLSTGLNLAAILRRKVLQVSLRRRSNFEAAETFINFTAISMQINFSHIISFKVASYSACYLTNGDNTRYLLEKVTRENKVIAAVKKWNCFQF